MDTNDFQALLGDAKALRVVSVGDIRVIEIEGDVPVDEKVFDAKLKRNYYYREQRMKYLGGGEP
jgi:hypothetical protein